jgi:hypothetical protein
MKGLDWNRDHCPPDAAMCHVIDTNEANPDQLGHHVSFLVLLRDPLPLSDWCIDQPPRLCSSSIHSTSTSPQLTHETFILIALPSHADLRQICLLRGPQFVTSLGERLYECSEQ